MNREIFNPEEYNFIKELAKKYGLEYGEITYVFHSGEVIGKDVLKKERIGKYYEPKRKQYKYPTSYQ